MARGEDEVLALERQYFRVHAPCLPASRSELAEAPLKLLALVCDVTTSHHLHFLGQQRAAERTSARRQHSHFFGLRTRLAGHFWDGRGRPSPDAASTDRSM